MARRALKACLVCGALSDGARCALHATKRPTAHQRGYTGEWQQYSKQYLAVHPWCAGYPAGTHGQQPVRATLTDHVIPHRGDATLFWDQDNHQPLCDSCHSVKTATQDGGFGN